MNRTNGPPASHYSSSTSAASTLRPRARRLISVEDDYNPGPGSESGGSARPSRAPSPIPRSHPSRPANALSSTQPPKALRDTSAALSSMWGSSWSAIQELATNVLGNEEDGAARKGRPGAAHAHARTSSSAPPKQWGPSTSRSSHIGTGSREDRESQVRALRRRDLLMGDEHAVSDSIGRMKRRNSDDRASSSAPPAENEERDALVYIHHVRPEDTLAGVTIKFNCSPAVLRKANRMWPNDSIQTKKVVVLPVDACAVKGRTVPGPDTQGDDLLLGDSSGFSSETVRTDTSANASTPHKLHSTENSLVLTASHSSIDSEPPWKHEKWVLLSNDTKPTEIGRMPRRTLGFFPPARRKSMAFSDTSTASFDLPRSSISTDKLDSPTSSRQTADRSRPSTNRTSSMSTTRGRGRSGSNSFVLHGPGGVGTLGKNVKSPGPAQDPLSKLLSPHLPSMEPPPEQEYFTPWAPSLINAGSGTSFQHGGSGARTPLGGPVMDFQEIGGAIEGWMRKVGSQASKLLSEPSTPGRGSRSAVPAVGAVGGDFGDLIELRDDAFDYGTRRDTSRGRSPMPTFEPNRGTGSEFPLTIRGRSRKGAEDRKTD